MENALATNSFRTRMSRAISLISQKDRHGEHVMDGFAGPDELHAQDHVRASHFQRDEPGFLRRGKQFVERLLGFPPPG